MGMEMVTKEDLQQFRLQLLRDLQAMLEPAKSKMVKPWLKNSEVRKLLNISSNTVQRLRVSGKLRSTKLGGMHFYRFEDIETLLSKGIE